jgi:hypothetical protein
MGILFPRVISNNFVKILENKYEKVEEKTIPTLDTISKFQFF